MSRNKLVAFVLFFWAMSCEPATPIDRQAVKEEMKSREIRKISSSEITLRAQELSKNIYDQLSIQHQQALSSADVAIENCKIDALPGVQAAKSSGIQILRWTQKALNTPEQRNSLENNMFEAYEYALAHQLPMTSSLSELDPSTLRYWVPIQMQEQCTSCHGKKTEIPQEIQRKLAARYTHFTSVDFEVGQLMGLWEIDLPKEVVIKSF
ncbi:MAG: DUF3365 domain-containing protein [Flammeovirgaceae bacterium]|nr:DUF3365 domain-containing protein [Flammeovirgaceae bacterium]